MSHRTTSRRWRTRTACRAIADRLAAGADGLPHGPAHVEPGAVLARPVPPGATRRHRDHELPHQGRQLRQFRRRELREVALAEPLGLRRDPPDGRTALIGVGFGVRVGRGLGGLRPRQRLIQPAQRLRQLVAPGRRVRPLGRGVRPLGRLDHHVRLRRDHLGPPRAARPARTEQLAEHPLEYVNLRRSRHHGGERAGVQLRQRRRAHHRQRARQPPAPVGSGRQPGRSKRHRHHGRQRRVIGPRRQAVPESGRAVAESGRPAAESGRAVSQACVSHAG